MSETRARSPRVHALSTRGIREPRSKDRVQEETIVALTCMMVDRDPAKAGVGESRNTAMTGKNRDRR